MTILSASSTLMMMTIELFQSKFIFSINTLIPSPMGSKQFKQNFFLCLMLLSQHAVHTSHIDEHLCPTSCSNDFPTSFDSHTSFSHLRHSHFRVYELYVKVRRLEISFFSNFCPFDSFISDQVGDC